MVRDKLKEMSDLLDKLHEEIHRLPLEPEPYVVELHRICMEMKALLFDVRHE